MLGASVLSKLSLQPVHSAIWSHITGSLSLSSAARATIGVIALGNAIKAVIAPAHFIKSRLVKPLSFKSCAILVSFFILGNALSSLKRLFIF